MYKPSLVTMAVWMMATTTVTYSRALAQPVMANPDLFEVELYADLAPLGRLKAWELNITTGENGFLPGLYMTSGPIPDDRSDRLLRIFGPDQFEVVADGFRSNESLVFARGPYGDGMLISEPQETRILRLLADGTRSTFSTDFTDPFGPAVLTYGPNPLGGPDEVLYTTDFSSGNVSIVNPDGTTSFFASVAPLVKALSVDTAGLYGGQFIASTFNFRDNPDTGAIYSISADGSTVNELASGLNGLQLLIIE